MFDSFDTSLHSTVSRLDLEHFHKSPVMQAIFGSCESEEFKDFDDAVTKAVLDKRIKVTFWCSTSQSHSYVAMKCKMCGYFMHTHWIQDSNAHLLKNLWLSWIKAEPSKQKMHLRNHCSPLDKMDGSISGKKILEKNFLQ